MLSMRAKHGFTIIELLIVLGLIATLAAILVPNFMKARARGQLTSCKSNLKNTATALEMYASDNKKLYPAGLAKLTPNYLKLIPDCPYARSDTYSASYQSALPIKDTEPGAFTVFCKGLNHEMGNLPANYPQYSSSQGLIER